MAPSNILSGILYVPQLIFYIRLVFFIALIIFGIIKGIQFLRKDKFHGKTKTIIISIISILIVAASWVFNMGWMRFMMTFLLIPLIHGIVFFIMNINCAKHFDTSRKIKVLNILFILTFILAYVFMPDMDDIKAYAFFGLIHDYTLISIAEAVCGVAFIAHIVLFVMQIAEIKKVKKNILSNE